MKFVHLLLATVGAVGLLVGCTHLSRPQPVITDFASELPDFEGAIWLVLASEDSDWNGFIAEGQPDLIEFRKSREGHYNVVFSDGWTEDPVLVDVRFLRTPDPNLVVMAAPGDSELYEGKEVFVPIPMSRSLDGSWVWCSDFDHENELIAGSIESHVARTAERLGIELHLYDSSGLTLENIITLFSDPDFIGGWRASPKSCLRLLPTNWGGFPMIEGNHPSLTGNLDLKSEAFPIAEHELAAPTSLAGTYTDFDLGTVKIAIQPDGGYMISPEHPSWQFSGLALKLMALDEPELYLGISECRSSEARGDFCYFSVKFEDGSDSITISAAGRHYQGLLEVLNNYTEQLQAKTLTAHGLDIDDHDRIVGDLNVERLRELFKDPHFQVTVEALPNRTLHLTPNAESAAED